MDISHFCIHITEEHLALAKAGEEPYCLNIVDEAEHFEELISEWRARVERAEKQFGKLTWFALPSYPVADSEATDQLDFPDTAYSILGVSENATVLIDDAQSYYERHIWRAKDFSGAIVEGSDGGSVTVRVQIDAVKAQILHRYYESRVKGTLFAQRCVAVQKLITCANNYNKMHKLECPAEILASVEESYNKRSKRCEALFHGMSPPSMHEEDWEEKLDQYLVGFGMTGEIRASLFLGLNVAPIDTYEAETRAVVSEKLEVHMSGNVISRNEILPTNTESVITAENMNEYIVPFTQIVTASKKAVADLTRLEKIARDYNKPITFI